MAKIIPKLKYIYIYIYINDRFYYMITDIFLSSATEMLGHYKRMSGI